MDLHSLRNQLVKYSHRTWELGWAANHDGNLTARMDRNRVVATPTAFSKREIREEDLLQVDLWTGKVTMGRHRPFSELPLHLEYFRIREDVNAVIHAHPPTVCGFAIAGVEVEPRISPEAVVSLGDRIPLAPPVFPNSLESKQQVRSLGRLYDVIMLGNHGIIACGTDLEQAFLRIELAENLAKMQQQAMILGNLRLINELWVGELLAKRKKAGLGPAARDEKSPPPQEISTMPVEEIISAMVGQLKD